LLAIKPKHAKTTTVESKATGKLRKNHRHRILVGFFGYRSVKQFNQARFVKIAHRGFAIWQNPFGMLEPQISANLLQQVCVSGDFMNYGPYCVHLNAWSSR
jgi:hypothetical protein